MAGASILNFYVDGSCMRRGPSELMGAMVQAPVAVICMYVESLGTFVEENGSCFIYIFICGLSNGADIIFL